MASAAEMDVGWSFVLARLQRRFWILRGQTCVTRYIKKCVFCQLRTAKSSSQMMAALPKERLLSGERAFFATGCDFLAQFMLQNFVERSKDGDAYLFVFLLVRFTLKFAIV